ncbi:GNAT family N-acetyltransferase [Haloactinomyces albus]|nr:GNAT family N-acetyltransferase [Haloactinomyces albus]
MTIASCTPTDGTYLAGLVARAFADNPVTKWLTLGMEAEPERQRMLEAYFRILVDYALRDGEVEATSDGSGAALWLPPEAPPPADYDERLAEATGHRAERFHTLDAAMHRAHPTDTRHHHLALLAVEPRVHSTGYGTALLEHHHRRLDEQGLDAYLEASAPRNRALYERMGYQLTGDTFELPDGPSMWPMRRPAPRAASR